MSLQGTDAYRDGDGTLPALVARAVAAARAHGFAHSCRPEQGRLLHLLAAGAPRAIAETGTGCGVGLAWLASGARPGTRPVGVERDAEQAGVAGEVFRDHPEVESSTETGGASRNAARTTCWCWTVAARRRATAPPTRPVC
jgi:predicted O-methyltransferase YrrM